MIIKISILTAYIAVVITFISGLIIGAITVEHTMQEECEETHLFSPRFIGEPVMCLTRKDYAHE